MGELGGQILEAILKLNDRFDSVERRLDRLEQRMDRLEERMDRLEERMDRLERRVDDVEKTAREALAIATASRDEIKELRAEMQGDIKDLRAEMLNGISNVRVELQSDIKELRAEMQGDIKDLRAERQREMEELRSEIRLVNRRFDTFPDINLLGAAVKTQIGKSVEILDSLSDIKARLGEVFGSMATDPEIQVLRDEVRRYRHDSHYIDIRLNRVESHSGFREGISDLISDL